MAKEKSTMDWIADANDTLEGFEDINAQTMSIPFLKLAQALTPQTKKAKQDVYIPGLEEGMFFNSVSKEIYGSSLRLIIIKFECIYIEWAPNRGGFIGYHSPENAINLAVDKTFGAWKTKEGNDLQEYYTYYCLIVGHENEGPIIMSLTSSAIKVAKNLNRLLTTQMMDNGKKAMPYYLIWNVEAAHVEKGENDWYMPKFTFSEYISEEQYKIIVPERKMLPDKPVDYALIEDNRTDKVAQENEF